MYDISRIFSGYLVDCCASWVYAPSALSVLVLQQVMGPGCAFCQVYPMDIPWIYWISLWIFTKHKLKLNWNESKRRKLTAISCLPFIWLSETEGAESFGDISTCTRQSEEIITCPYLVVSMEFCCNLLLMFVMNKWTSGSMYWLSR